MVFATNSSRSFVEQAPLDPSSGLTGGPPTVAYQGARSILSCDVSPDGAWLVLWASSPSEDLLLIRPDGSELRQLTNDLARDRTPFWSPDGSRILFASDRSGKYEAWTIRADGSGLTQVTHLPDRPVLSPFWSPDGRTIGFNYVNHGTALLDLGARSKLRVLPSAGGGHTFAGVDWSADGRFLAGKLLRPDEASVPGIILWSLADNTFRRVTLVGQDLSLSRDGERIFFTEDGKVQTVSVANGEVRTVLTPPPHSSYVSVSVGDKNLCTVRLTDEGDIWSLALDGPSNP
jgi:WD40 repeat protein